MMEYKSPLRKLVRFFEKSRDKWKQKYQQARNEIKLLKNKLYYQQQKHQKQEQRLKALAVENQTLKAKLTVLEQLQLLSEAQVKKAGELLEMRSAFEQKIPHHQYTVGFIQMLLQLVFDGATHLRTSSRCMKIIGNLLPGIDTDVSWYSVRLWVMRLGCYELTRAFEPGDDWIWIIDHSIQLSNQKCLVIVGFRLSSFGKNCKPLQHRDLSLISLDVVSQSNGALVCEQLQQAVKKTGVPRAIIHDHGSELKKGVTQFKEQYLIIPR